MDQQENLPINWPKGVIYRKVGCVGDLADQESAIKISELGDLEEHMKKYERAILGISDKTEIKFLPQMHAAHEDEQSRGLYAKRAIQKGEIIGEYTGN